MWARWELVKTDLPPDARYISDYLGFIESTTILDHIDQAEWKTDLKRRVQHYGYRYDYRARRASRDDYLGSLPIWLQAISEKLSEDAHFSDVPEQVIINEYEPGQGIAPHIDCEPCFGDTVASISLGSACEMQFVHKRNGEKKSILLESNSLLMLSGEARYDWTHGIAARKSDIVHGKRLPRSRRLSLTFRKMIL